MPEGTSRRVIVVDNGGGISDSLLSRWENVSLIRTGENLGYLNGANVGKNALIEQIGGSPNWWILANADICVSPVFFQRLLTGPWANSIALLSPDVREDQAWPRNPFHHQRPSSLKILSRIALFSTKTLTDAYVKAARWKRVIATPPSIPAKPKRIYSTHGSLMVFHNRFFERGGTLEYGGFLYGEEIHVAEQVRRMGLNILWAPSLQAHHQGGTAMELVSMDQRRKWWKQSYAFLYRTYFQND